MIASGLSLLRTLTILSEQTENKKLPRRWMRCARTSSGARPLAGLLAATTIFPPLMIHLVRAGETGGFLEKSLESAAKNFEKEVKLRNTIKSAMTYPVVVLIMALLSVVAC